jgi:hypothetical protein
MEFLKKHWYLPVMIALVLYIITVPRKTYKLVPKENLKNDSIISILKDSVNSLTIQKNELQLADREIIKTETLTVEVKVPSKPKEIIVVKNEEIIKEVNCATYYTDRERDSIWSKINSK